MSIISYCDQDDKDCLKKLADSVGGLAATNQLAAFEPRGQTTCRPLEAIFGLGPPDYNVFVVR